MEPAILFVDGKKIQDGHQLGNSRWPPTWKFKMATNLEIQDGHQLGNSRWPPTWMSGGHQKAPSFSDQWSPAHIQYIRYISKQNLKSFSSY
jgi:hypothetical protein